MIVLVVLVPGLPLLGALAAVTGAHVRWLGRTLACGCVGGLAAAITLAARVMSGGTVTALDGFIHVDPLGAFFVVTVAVVTALAGVGSAPYLEREVEEGALSGLQVRLYAVFFALFGALMLASMETGSLGLLWVLIEASTLASVVVVGLEAKASSLEAAWKYVIISALGVTMALVATLFMFYAAGSLGLSPTARLTWVTLFTHAHHLQHDSLRLAFLLAVVGYGTKVGLAPMHTWLPDAHSEAPSPVSAMLSAALLNTGMYAIIRFQAIAHVALGAYTSHVLLVFGFLSVVIGVLFMIRRGNFKRLFAYSSIEHMGIIAIALGFGGVLGLYGALLHTLNHAIGKCVLFLTSGELVLRYHTRQSTEVVGVLGAMPVVGGAMLFGSVAILGSPPFGLFLSEFTIVRAGFARASPALPALLLLLLIVAFIAFARTVTDMAVGAPPAEVLARRARLPVRIAANVPIVVGLLVLLLLGVTVPAGLDHLLVHSIGAMR